MLVDCGNDRKKRKTQGDCLLLLLQISKDISMEIEEYIDGNLFTWHREKQEWNENIC